MADPRQGHLAEGEFGEPGPDVLADAGSQERLLDQFMEEGARVEMFAWGQILERARQQFAALGAFASRQETRLMFAHVVHLQRTWKNSNSVAMSNCGANSRRQAREEFEEG